jgi:Uma2 family endonuclease
MTDLTPSIPSESTRLTTEQYFGLVETGVLSEEDRVELLEGVIVAMTPTNPPHDSAVTRVSVALYDAVGRRAVVRTQCTFLVGRWSAPEPDVAVVAGSLADYDDVHPRTALLVVEVADSSLPQDRISKARIYAAAGVPEYWIANLRDGVVEVLREPDAAAARYRDSHIARPGDRLELAALPGAAIAVSDLLPARERR